MAVRGQLHAPTTLPLGRELSTHLTEDWVGPHSQSKCFGEQKYLLSCQDWKPGLSNPWPIHYINNTIAACGHYKNNEVRSVLYLMTKHILVEISVGFFVTWNALQFSAVPLHICWGSHSGIPQPLSSSLPVPQPTTCSHIAWVIDHTVK